MDKQLVNKVKAILVNCNANNTDSVKSKLMVLLKPTEADDMYEYFLNIEPDYIKDTCKVNQSQVLPQYIDYYTDNSVLKDVYLDEDRDLD